MRRRPKATGAPGVGIALVLGGEALLNGAAAAPSEVIGASAPASSPIPFKPTAQLEAPGLGEGWWVAILCLVVLAVLALWLRRRAGGLPRFRPGPRAISVLESTRLGERMRLSVVRYRGREMLIGHGDQNAIVLADDPIEPSAVPRP